MPDRRGFLGAVAALVAAPWAKRIGTYWPNEGEAISYAVIQGFDLGAYYDYLALNPPPLCNAIITDLKDPYAVPRPVEHEKTMTVAANPDQIRRYIEDLNFIGPLQPDEEED